MDGTLYLEVAGERGGEDVALSLRTLKRRDGERPEAVHLRRRRVSLSVRDELGFPLTSCVVEPDTRTREDLEAERVEAAEATWRADDLRLLRALREHPEATSQKQLAVYAGIRAASASDALARVARAGWVEVPAKQRQPYHLTTAGLEALGGAQ